MSRNGVDSKNPISLETYITYNSNKQKRPFCAILNFGMACFFSSSCTRRNTALNIMPTKFDLNHAKNMEDQDPSGRVVAGMPIGHVMVKFQ